MKLNINYCRAYCESKEIINYTVLFKDLELNVEVIRLHERRNEIGNDAVKDIYNKLGEKAVLQIIDLREETLNGFKSKYS